jgi:ClpP class serine protease
MSKLRDIIFEVLSEKSDVLNEQERLEMASRIEEKYKNFVKEIAKSAIMKKAVENIEARIGSKLITPQQYKDLKKNGI